MISKEDLLYDSSRDGYRFPKDRLEKILALIGILKYKRRKTLKELATLLEKSDRQIRRDLKSLEKFFDLDYDDLNRPFIFTEKNEDGIYVNLTEEEVQLLTNLLKNSRNQLKNSIIKKLDRNLYFDFNDQIEFAEIIDLIQTAINQKRQILLKGYRSANSKCKEDHLVEPILITDLKYVSAFDHKDHITKIFSVLRIEDGIDITDNSFSQETKHRHLKPDLFGMMTGKAHHVSLKLTDRAYLLLREEYPRTVQSIHSTGDENFPWQFSEWLYGLEGVGRFILGLLNEIEIENPVELKNYISYQIDLFSKNRSLLSKPSII